MRIGIFRAYVHRAIWKYISRDRRTIIEIQFAHSCTVYVGLAQARPNCYTKVRVVTVVQFSLLHD